MRGRPERWNQFFLGNENQVGDDTAEALYARIAHMCGLLEDSTKHVQLCNDLMQHICENHQFILFNIIQVKCHKNLHMRC